MTGTNRIPAGVSNPLELAKPGNSSGGEIELAQDLEEMLLRYVLIYGRDEVWDGWTMVPMKMAALRLLYARELLKDWQAHPKRRVIAPEAVVFDPSGKHVPAGGLNQFTGWPLTPRRGDVSPFLDPRRGGR